MRLFKGKSAPAIVPDPKMLARAKKVDTSQLLIWLDNSVMGLGIALDRWRYHDAPSGEASMALEAVVAIWHELQARGLTEE